jgi:hypothetical protein
MQKFIFHFVTIKLSFAVVFISKGCEVLHSLFFFRSAFHEHWLINLPLSNLRKWRNLISVRGPWSASAFLWTSIQCNSAIFKFFCTTETYHFGRKPPGHKHSLTWPPRGHQTRSNHTGRFVCLYN